MTTYRKHLDILCNYHDDCVAYGAEALGNVGGYSGAAFWKVRGPKGTFCLRRWSEKYPTLERIQFIHAVQWHLQQEGVCKFPMPIDTIEGMSYVFDGQSFWQLEPWMQGEADFLKHPNLERLINVMTALGEFHNALRTFPVEHETGTSPTFLEHEKTLLTWTNSRLNALEERILFPNDFHSTDLRDVMFISDLSDSVGPAETETQCIGNSVTIPCRTQMKVQLRLQNAAMRILPAIRTLRRPVLTQVVRLSNQMLALEPCIHDIHADHLFFQKERFSGFIDFGSVGVDTVSVDVARTLNALAPLRSGYWVAGLMAYQSVRRLSQQELEAVQVLRKSSLLTTAIRWLDYIFMQNQPVKCSARLVLRMEKLADSLEHI